MGEFAKLLEPISPDNPVGVDAYYAKEFADIKEARRQEDTAPQGEWERETKVANYPLTAQLIEHALVGKTKDLRLSAWLAEAWIYLDGPAGLVSGIQFLQAFLEKFWDNFYPKIEEDGDLGERFAAIDWFGSYLDPAKNSSPSLAVYRTPLVNGKYDFYSYQESRKVGSEADVKDNEGRKKTRLEMIAEGKLPAETFDRIFESTPKAFYKQAHVDYKQALVSLGDLDNVCREKFPKGPPSFGVLRKAIESVLNVVQILLNRKLKTDPDPIEPAARAETTNADGSPVPQQDGPQVVFAPNIDLSQFGGGTIDSIGQAQLHVLAAAQFLRRVSPGSPLSYLLLRALRWGEVRELGELNTAELFAPSGETRVALRTAAAVNNWQQVLDIAETAMSNLTGRGWLDSQRYSVRACEELGYTSAARALRSELKCFLADFPDLPKAVLNDDTGAANPETLAWLEKEGLLPK